MTDIPKGYKQTEVGVIPDDWEVIQLEEASRIIDSLHQTPRFSGDGYPMVELSRQAGRASLSDC